MGRAGEKEKAFINLISKVNPELLKGKLEFGSPKAVFVSVDNSIEFEDTIFLIEIDASNMAKLVAGQYTLLNILINEQSEKSKKIIDCSSSKELVFLVVHYYGTGDTKYNSERSMKNFRKIDTELLANEGIKFASVHIEDLKAAMIEIKKTESIEKYLKGLTE